ncbi:hypothetical protein PR202_ga31004 [Eleusine coracana subsp. coracana]|uniref:Uncharacterized protein n=1 Tax=Eleusine coracana subsp. coracana TaxID=191504 RepID=A0AAV5DPV2_ELECO|nr:hypothetical protein PR202_ga31004 [Eleusine coracana subsp. coracana]
MAQSLGGPAGRDTAQPDMDIKVEEMLQLIDRDGDSLAKTAYILSEPSNAHHPCLSFYRMYHALSERYDKVTGELKNNDSAASKKEHKDMGSQSESDAKSEDGEDDGIAYALHQRVLELEEELNMNQKLCAANRKLEVLKEKSLRCHCDYTE